MITVGFAFDFERGDVVNYEDEDQDEQQTGR